MIMNLRSSCYLHHHCHIPEPCSRFSEHPSEMVHSSKNITGSEGREELKKSVGTLKAAYQHLLEAGYPSRPPVNGESLGCAVAVELASRGPCRSCWCLRRRSVRPGACRAVLPLDPLVIWSYNSKQRIAHVRAPLLIMHGDRDEVIPFDLGRALLRAPLPTPKSFSAVPGAGHNDIIPGSRPHLPRPPAGVVSLLEVIIYSPSWQRLGDPIRRWPFGMV